MNSTLSGNTAGLAGGGIGFSGDVTLTHRTFAGNEVNDAEYRGGAIYHRMGALALTHTIMADSIGGDCHLGENVEVILNACSLVENGSCSAALPDDPPLGDLLLGELADNGGPTWTIAPLPGSPALNAGDEAYWAPAELRGTVNARYGATSVTFEYGPDTHYGTTVVAAPSHVAGTGDVAVSATLSGLTPNTTYHYRVVAASGAGTTYGADASLVALPHPWRDLYLPAIRR